MRYRRLPIEIESPEQFGYDRIRFNLAESSVHDRTLESIDPNLPARLAKVVLAYGDHLGLPELRARISAPWSVSPDEIIVTPGAAAALFMVNTTCVRRGDHVVIARPNYATNVETPRAIGADVTYLDTTWGDGWLVTADAVSAAMTDRTALVSLTSPGNPTGAVLAEAELRAIVEVIERHPTARLLVDETYRDLTFGTMTTPAVSLSPRIVGVSSLSKAYGIPGIRIGWLATRDPSLLETLLAAKEQIVIANSVVDETIALAALEARNTWLPETRAAMLRARDTVATWIEDSPFEWIGPGGGAVGFPRPRPEVEIDVDRFYERLFKDHGAVVGPGHWFEQSRRSFRLGFGWPVEGELAGGLAALTAAAGDARL
ncbi:MAG: pyridoxal phosphate-dependent aminotransferase [Chloroflexota bacterium]